MSNQSRVPGINIEEIEERLEAKEQERQRLIQEARDKVNAKAEARRQAEEAEREAKRQEAEERLQKRRAQEFDRQHKQPALSAWLATGGDRASFEQAWPEMRERIRQQVIETEVERRRKITASWYRRSF